MFIYIIHSAQLDYIYFKKTFAHNIVYTETQLFNTYYMFRPSPAISRVYTHQNISNIIQ